MTVLDADRVRELLGRLRPADRKVALRGLELLAHAADQSIAARTEKAHV
jgi:hypothetical protein